MTSRTCKLFVLTLFSFSLGGCASYAITEQEINEYLQDKVGVEQSVGIQHVMYAQVEVDGLEVKIGRADKDRMSVFANTNAEVQLLGEKSMTLDLDIEFSAIPEYDQENGEVFLKSLRLEQFTDNNNSLTPEISQLLKPAVSLIGNALSQRPVYKLDSTNIEEALLMSAEPNLVIKDNKLVIEVLK